MATARASTAGGRSGRLATLGATRSVVVRARDHRQQGPGVEEPRLVGVVLHGDQVQADLLGELRERDDPIRLGGGGVTKVPNSRSCP